MDKDRVATDIEHLVRISQKKKEALKAFSEAVNLVRELYGIDAIESRSVLAIMQSIIVGYTVDSSCDNPTLKDIIAEAESILSRHAEGKSEANPLTDKQKKYIKLFLGDEYGKCTDGYLMNKLGVFEWKEAEKLIEQYKSEGKNE